MLIKKFKLQNNKKFIIVISLMCCVTPAFAYIDPGSGSLMLQILAAVIIGVFFKLKNYLNLAWTRIKSLFKL